MLPRRRRPAPANRFVRVAGAAHQRYTELGHGYGSVVRHAAAVHGQGGGTAIQRTEAGRALGVEGMGGRKRVSCAWLHAAQNVRAMQCGIQELSRLIQWGKGQGTTVVRSCHTAPASPVNLSTEKKLRSTGHANCESCAHFQTFTHNSNPTHRPGEGRCSRGRSRGRPLRGR